MQIVGIKGDIGHGKTTLAQYLAGIAPTSQTYESSSLISEVANDLQAQDSPERDIAAINRWLQPLPSILVRRVRAHTTLDDIKLTPEKQAAHPEYYNKLFAYLDLIQQHPELSKTVINPDNKDRFRPLLQWLGGYLPTCMGGEVWYAEIVRRIQEAPPVELAIVGGVRYPADAACIWGAKGLIIEVQRPQLSDKKHTDITEQEAASIIPDVIVVNNGSLDDLDQCAQKLYGDLHAGRPQARYVALGTVADPHSSH